MEATELRIGIYVNVPREDQSPFRIDAFESLSNKFIKVAMIHPDYGETFHPLTWYGDDLKPIPLTERWLLDFGYKSIGKLHLTYKLNPFIIELSVLGSHYNFRKIISKEESMMLKEIKHVHQLQNLYFALTGKELTTKQANE